MFRLLCRSCIRTNWKISYENFEVIFTAMIYYNMRGPISILWSVIFGGNKAAVNRIYENENLWEMLNSTASMFKHNLKFGNFFLLYICLKVNPPVWEISDNRNPFKNDESVFYFILKALYILEMFTCLSWLFG